MNWYLQSNNESDVVKSTKIRLARNLSCFNFNINEKEEMEKLENLIKDNLYAIGYDLKFFRLKDMDNITKMSLVEKNLISSDFVLKKGNTGSILINNNENICIMIGGEDHLNIQVFNCGLDLENTLNLAVEIDNKIGSILQYAMNKKYGYLTSCPNDIGTGLKASIRLNLPGLSKTGNIRKTLNIINSFGINVRNILGDTIQTKCDISDIYEISNKQTLGITENEIIENLKVIIQKVIEQERQARKLLTKDKDNLEDMIHRSYGILSSCRKISYKEASELLSNIKLGTDLGILEELTDLKVQKLYLYIKPANLQKYLGDQYETIECEKKRAEVIRKIIAEK